MCFISVLSERLHVLIKVVSYYMFYIVCFYLNYA
jgi:hypothetical protein